MNKIFCLYDTIPGELESNIEIMDKIREDYTQGKITLNQARKKLGIFPIEHDVVNTKYGVMRLSELKKYAHFFEKE